MMLSVRTVKDGKNGINAVHKTYRFPCFDTALEFNGLDYESKFNRAFDVLKEEIDQDRTNNDMVKYEPIRIVDVFLS